MAEYLSSPGHAYPATGTETKLSPSAAHEINNPLDSLLNLLCLLETESSLSDRGRHFLSLAEDEVRRIAQIARDALDQHKAVIHEVPAPKAQVGELLHDVIDFYQQKINACGITVRTRYSGSDDVPVRPEQMRRVFSNLLINAVEATPRGGEVQARVSAGREWSGLKRKGVRVSVSDNGSGIPAEVLPQIFREFYTTKSEGHGMGLSLVKDIVRNHNGTLRVRSSTRPGHSGTVFNLFLPAV